MPAVTVDDTLTLPPITAPDPATTGDRPVRSVTTAPSGFEGEGFPVRRAFAGVRPEVLDPFVHMDQMGEVDYGPGEPRGTSWHPHRGFETVTYMIEGIMAHQDSIGGGGVIADGATQWMTAGAGILHIEAPPEELVATGGLFHGIQLWVNLPRADKWIDPAYQDIVSADVALATTPDGGALVRIIAGQVGEHRGPGTTRTPITLSHLTIQPDAQVRLPWPADHNALAYVLDGTGTVGTERRPVQQGQLTVFGDGDIAVPGADSTLTLGGSDPARHGKPMEVLVLGGRPIREPVAHYGPFVMNTENELRQAIADFQAGKLGTVPG